MFPIPSNEILVETKTCTHCGISFPITDKDLEFYDKVSPVFAWKKYSIPTPTFCPDCRQQRRLSFRNERKLYKRKCDATGKDIISIYSPDKVNKVYHQDFWWSDKWDPMDYGRDFDFGRGFFEQFGELMRGVAHPNLITDFNSNVNSEYINYSGKSKNCYLVFENGDCEDDYYCYHIYSSNDCMDCLGLFNCTDCYSCVDCSNCHSVYQSINCENSSQSSFLYNCIDCTYCFGCTNITNKKYCIFNTQYTEEEYKKLIWKIQQEYTQKDFFKNITTSPRKALFNKTCENVSGNMLINSKNVKWSWYSTRMQDSAYVSFFIGSSEVYDCHSWWANLNHQNAQKCYEAMSIGNGAYNTIFSNLCWESVSDISYSYSCGVSKYLFGCIWLRNKSYCILNKQYTKEEYEGLVPRIIEHMMKTGEWGEFFPASISPFGYNETVASEYFPLSKSEGLSQGFNWSDYEAPFPRVEKIIKASMLPDDISKIPDDILNWAIECEVTGKPFRIIPQELEFYRKHHISIPHRHPDQRHLDRMSLRNPRKLFERQCDCCQKDIITTYSPERPETVYCEECYLKIA